MTGLKAQVDVTKRQLKTIQPMQGRIHEVAKSNKKSEALHRDEKSQRQTANGSCFKFFSIESLHNWALTGYSDSSTSLVFCGLSAETSIQLSYSISSTSNVTLNAKFGRLPRSTNSFLSVTGVNQTRFHPAVSGCLKWKKGSLILKIMIIYADLSKTYKRSYDPTALN